MAGVVGGVVGATVGFFVGGPAGAQWGWAIGAGIGNSFTTIKQPRIGELAEIRAGEGGPRARVYGTFRPIGGQVVWSGRPREIRRRQRQGKGGPKVESSTILRSYAIGICEGPVSGVTRIWRNNELVYDVRPGSAMLAESAKWLQGKTVMLGGWDQLPHPTLEAELGAANAPAWRGTAVLVVTDEDLTDLRGAIPAYQFEVGQGVGESLPPRYEGGEPPEPVPPGLLNGGVSAFNLPSGRYPTAAEIAVDPFGQFIVPPSANAVIYKFRSLVDGIGPTRWYGLLDDSRVTPDYFLESPTELYVVVPASPGQVITVDGFNPNSSVPVTFQYWTSTLSFEEAGELIGGPAGFFPGDEQESSLRAIVRSVCVDARIEESRLDVAALPDVVVPGFATSPDYTAAEAIRELAKIYFFDASDADGVVRFVPRGGNFQWIVTEDDFVDGEDEPETDTTRDSLSVPRLLHLTYFDIEGGQGADKQFSERQISPRTDAPVVLQTPVVLEAERAARALRVQHQVMEDELRGDLVFGLSDQFIGMATADVVIVQYRGRSQRCLVKKLELMDGWQRVTCQRDRQSAYTTTVQAVPPAAVTLPPSTIVGASRFAFLDLPALTQAGDVLTYHVATSGEVPAWRGAAIERDAGAGQFELITADTVGTVMGTLTAALPLSSEYYPDETNAIVVQLARGDDELEAVTREQWLGRANAAALVRPDGTAEVVQFREAVETTPGTWRLTGLQRGRLSSGASAHAVGATFVLLDGAIAVQTGSERIGSTLTHRAYSLGNDPATATTQARTWTGRSQREWSPIIETADRVADTVTVTWTPRHRFGSDESPVASTHFDGWQVDATSGGTTRSAHVLTPTASLDVTGLANPITVTVRGRNRLAGLGDPATRILP